MSVLDAVACHRNIAWDRTTARHCTQCGKPIAVDRSAPARPFRALQSLDLQQVALPGDEPIPFDGVGRFVAWRGYVAGVVKSVYGYSVVRLRGPMLTRPAAAGEGRVDGSAGGEVWTAGPDHDLPAPDDAADGHGFHPEPVVEQGVLFFGIANRLYACDLLAGEPNAVVLLELPSNCRFFSTVTVIDGQVCAVVARDESELQVLSVPLVTNESGVLDVRAADRWMQLYSLSESLRLDGDESLHTHWRSLAAGGTLMVPLAHLVAVAVRTKPAGGATWSWRRAPATGAVTSFGAPQHARVLHDRGRAPSAPQPARLIQDRGRLIGAGTAPVPSPATVGGGGSATSLLLKAQSAGAKAVTVEMALGPAAAAPDTPAAFFDMVVPLANQDLVVGGGQLFAVESKASCNVIFRLEPGGVILDSLNPPRPESKVERILPLGRQLLALVRNESNLQLNLYDAMGKTLSTRAIRPGVAVSDLMWSAGHVALVFRDGTSGTLHVAWVELAA